MDDRARRLEEAARNAKAADARGDHWEANEWWTRYGLIEDGGREPSELLARGAALNRAAEKIRASVRAGR